MERQWTDVPPDLLAKMADMLGLIDLLSFRSVCRDWKTATSWASAEIELQNPPWFLTYGDADSQCTLLSNNDRLFTLTIPEMHNSTCLASYAGWLLLFLENSLFFFCPFSRSKILLPSSPFSDPSGHIGAFSSPPTSSQCIVGVIRSESSVALQLFLLRKGSKEWTEHRFQTEMEFVSLQGASFQGRSFHVLDGSNGLITYDYESKERKRFVLGPPMANARDKLSYGTSTRHFMRRDLRRKLRLQNNVSISVCPAIVPGPGFGVNYDILIKGENVEAIEGGEIRPLKGTWIQPTYFQVAHDYSW